MGKKTAMVYDEIWMPLPNFPQRIVDLLHKEYNDFLGGDSSLPNISNSEIQVINAQPTLTIIPQKLDLGIKELSDRIMWQIVLPDSPMGIIHADRSRTSAINIPIKVNDPKKGPYIAGRFNSLDDYPESKPFELDNKVGYHWDYDEKLFQRIPITQPIYINTALPHAWKNDDNDYRVLASISFHEQDADVTANIAKQWT